MKIVMLLAAALLAAPPARAEEGKYAKLAHNVITSTAQVKPGEVVLISGGKHTTPLLEELAIETFKAGGLPVISLDSDRIERAVGFDVKADYLSQEWKFYGEWLKTTDVLINLPNIEDPALFARIPADRQAKLGAAGAVITEALNKSHVRSINLAFPSRQEAAAFKVGFEAYEKMTRDSMSVDYAPVAEAGDKLKALLGSAKQVHVTSAAGTDVTFSPGGRPVSVEAGLPRAGMAGESVYASHVVNLPGGRMAMAPLETSANGKVVVPKDLCGDTVVKNQSFELKEGKITGYKADSDCITKLLAPYAGEKDRFGYFRIGLNPGQKVIDSGESRLFPGFAAGMVWIGVGDNAWVGGQNRGGGGWVFPVTRATVEVDGKVIVKDGKLSL